MTAENESPTPGPDDETKARFREALDRKQQAEHRTEEARRNTGNVHGSEVAGGKRTFRRKTG